jgi:probable F420-dependent oxidoreductase
MSDKPFQFAVVSTGETSRQRWTELARRAEDLGYDQLLVTHHVHQELSPVPALAYAAAVTSRLVLGTYVLGNDFRNPMLLAKEIATLALLSDHRVQLGIGAGWLRDDYDQTGVAFEPGPDRYARLEESLTILQALFTEGRCKFHGRHHEVAADEFLPTLPRPPRLLVGGGRRRLLGLAARRADVVSFLPRSTPAGELDDTDATPERLDAKVAWVRAAAPDRFDDLVLNHVLWECMVTPRPEPILEVFARSLGCTPAQVRQVPSMLIGSAASVTETLLERRARWGLSLVTVPATALRAFAPVVAALRGR